MMKKYLLFIILLSLYQIQAQTKNDWKIKLKIGNELRIPVLNYVEDNSLQSNHNGLLSFNINRDLKAFLNGFPIHYAVEFKIYKTWSFEFQHSIHYDHVAYKEAVQNVAGQKTVSSGLNQFFSDYKFSFFKYFIIDERQQFNLNLGYSFNGLGSYYWVYQHHYLTTTSNHYTSFHLESNYQYKFMSLGLGIYVLDQPDFNVFTGSIKAEDFSNYLIYFNLDFDILKF